MSSLNPSEGRLGHLSHYSACRLVRAGYMYTIKILAPELLTAARMLPLHMCATIHA